MHRSLAKLSSLARDFFGAFPDRELMPLDGLAEEAQRAFAEHVQPIARTAAGDDDGRLARLTLLAVRLSDAPPNELASARRAADYAQLTAALAVVSAAEHFARNRAVAAALCGADATALERWRQENVRRRLVAAGFAHATAPLVQGMAALPAGGDKSSSSGGSKNPPEQLLRPFAASCAAVRSCMLPAPAAAAAAGGQGRPAPALRRRLDQAAFGCLHGLLCAPQDGWLARQQQENGAQQQQGEQGGGGGGGVVLAGPAVAWLVAGGGGNAPRGAECPFDVAYVGFASPAAAARACGDGLVSALSQWRARRCAPPPWPGVEEGGGEGGARAAAAQAEEPVASLGADGCLSLRLPDCGPAAVPGACVVVRMLPCGCGGGGGGGAASPLLALERLLLQGGVDPSVAGGAACSPSPALAFDGDAVWGLPRAADALRDGGLVLEARAGAGGDEGGEGDEGWAARRAAQLRRAAARGWQARVPVPADDGEGAREARALEAACAAAEAEAAEAEAAPQPAGSGAAARSWAYAEFVRPPEPTALPAGLLEAVTECWEALARRPPPRGPYELVAF